MTKEEKHLWYDFFKSYRPKFTRQKVLGKYIVDFYCASVALVVEIDGSQHFEECGILNDAKRTEYLEKFGIKVIRISNADVFKNFEAVCAYIDSEVKKRAVQKN